MLDLWTMLVYLAACLGVPLAALGLVLRLCEWDRGKRRGALGSSEAFGWGTVLCLPFAYHLMSHALS
jgi:hypothetical protein